MRSWFIFGSQTRLSFSIPRSILTCTEETLGDILEKERPSLVSNSSSLWNLFQSCAAVMLLMYAPKKPNGLSESYLWERLTRDRRSLVVVQGKLHFLPMKPICWASRGITIIRPPGLELWWALKMANRASFWLDLSVFLKNFQKPAGVSHSFTSATNFLHFHLLQSDHSFPSATLLHSHPFSSTLD